MTPNGQTFTDCYFDRDRFLSKNVASGALWTVMTGIVSRLMSAPVSERRGGPIAYEQTAAGNSLAAIFRDARLRQALRMRTECMAANSWTKLPLSLILRRPRSGRLEGRGVRSGVSGQGRNDTDWLTELAIKKVRVGEHAAEKQSSRSVRCENGGRDIAASVLSVSRYACNSGAK